MSTPCSDHQQRLLDELDQIERSDVELSRHLAVCCACAAVAKRCARLARALRELTREATPMDLDGRVVSACNAGYREDRAVLMVRNLTRGGVPAELDEKIRRDASVLGPTGSVNAEHIGIARVEPSEVLDRLVAEDLRNPAQAAVRRFASRLTRVSAPEELNARVDEELRRRVLAPRFPARALRRSVAAAALVLFGYVGVHLWLDGGDRPATRRPFHVERVTDVAALDPMVRSLVSGLSGGLVQTSKISSDDK